MPRTKTKTTAPATKSSKISFAGLRQYNFIAALLHFAQGILVLVLASASRGLQPISIHYLSSDRLASQVSGHTVVSAATRHLYDLNLAYVVAVFFFISAIAHLLAATIYRSTYEADLRRQVNKARWIEYAFSAAVMMAAIAMLSGILDVAALTMVFVLTAVMSLLGWVMELHNQPGRNVNWSSFRVGVLAGAAPWVAVLIYIIGALVFGGSIPAFIYLIYISLFVLFSSFAVNMYLQYKKRGRWSDYLYGERAYIVLSLVAKTALAWQIFFGTLR